MNLKTIKQSMLYTACEYRKEPVDMKRFQDINTGAKIAPESDILRFYLGAHIMAVAEQKFGIEADLPADVASLVQEHHANMEDVFFRIFTYVLLISIGESRHGSTAHKSSKIGQQYGEEVQSFAQQIDHGGRSSARDKFLNQDRDLLQFARYLDWMFVECFGGGSYGGPKWRNISNKITQVLEGEISPFTMTDVAWALVHNTGSIFNKNTIYNSEHSSLTHLLDFQRGGAIPSLIWNLSKYKAQCKHLGAMPNPNILESFRQDVEDASKILGEDLTAYVPPIKIHEAGALTSSFNVGTSESSAKVEGESDLEFTGENLDVGVAILPKLKRQGG